jgi:tRNA pseudouridine13 synthase
MIDPPLLTADLTGIGGRIKVLPEDFEVEEIPAYEPLGQGDHLYLWIEKRDLGAEFFLREIANRLQVKTSDIGCAGLKDRRAVTRQWISTPGASECAVSRLDGDGIRVLEVTRHTNKLRTGHLRGNRFRVLIRDVRGDPEPILTRIRTFGLPNFYGPQRFGRGGETATLGMALLRRQQPRAPNPFLKKLALSAAQSLLLNDNLARPGAGR